MDSHLQFYGGKELSAVSVLQAGWAARIQEEKADSCLGENWTLQSEIVFQIPRLFQDRDRIQG
jgi:hypothetical protein